MKDSSVPHGQQTHPSLSERSAIIFDFADACLSEKPQNRRIHRLVVTLRRGEQEVFEAVCLPKKRLSSLWCYRDCRIVKKVMLLHGCSGDEARLQLEWKQACSDLCQDPAYWWERASRLPIHNVAWQRDNTPRCIH